MKLTRRAKVTILALVSVVLFVLIFVLASFYSLLPPRNPGPFNRHLMERIVQKVRQQDFKGEQQFAFDHDGNLKPSGKVSDPRAIAVDARREDDGTLSLTIQTVDRGHFGSFGFAYSDRPPKPEKDPNSGSLILDVPSEMNEVGPEGKIDEHWWKVSDTKE